ncbi:MAG TPA: glycosyltransferase [Gemmatimonadales bacterium]|nr:glycosyltransferase [Gemmatimonadales bacterium]
MLALVILSALGLLLYAWAGYPLLLGLVGKRAPSAVPLPLNDGRVVRLSVILSAFNEESVIEARLTNLSSIAASLPASANFRVFVGVDGATDRTAEVARRLVGRDSRLHLHDFGQRRGKVTVLKDLVAAARLSDAGSPGTRLLLFTDANTFFRPDAASRLLAHFVDNAVGGVCGRLVFTAAPGRESPESAYWEWETWLKSRESALDSCLGANGAIYAIREELFWEGIPANTVVDDFVIGMKIREQGFRMLYEPAAVAEEESPNVASEWTRRVRIGSGDFQALALCRRCLAPQFGWFAWMFWSHKVLRWFTPHLCLLAFSGALLAMTGTVPSAGPLAWLPLLTTIAFAGLLGCAVLGRFWRRSSGGLARLFQLCDHFVTMQAALFVGFLRWCRGDLTGHWTRTPRR